jgi:Mlc titration factor MtfA (ptsG expression regulator)
LFLQDKHLTALQGVELHQEQRLLLAAQAQLPLLHLGDLNWYQGFHEIVLYPDDFLSPQRHRDASGVEHEWDGEHSGEAWQQGPIILAWPGVMASGGWEGYNLVIHELAHKLDMLNGDANGFPPLHRRMDRREWSRVFSTAWDRLKQAQGDGVDLPVDPYALENPAEFFAVASEQFFETPTNLREHLPDVYRQLELFYRQHPL